MKADILDQGLRHCVALLVQESHHQGSVLLELVPVIPLQYTLHPYTGYHANLYRLVVYTVPFLQITGLQWSLLKRGVVL